MKRFFTLAAALLMLAATGLAQAQANIEVDTPAINALKKSMQTRFCSEVVSNPLRPRFTPVRFLTFTPRQRWGFRAV